MRRLILSLLILSNIGLAQQNPTLQQYLTSNQTANLALYTNIVGRSFPKPVFGAQFEALFQVYCGQTGCNVFNATQAEHQADMLFGAPPSGLGYTSAVVNISMFIYVDDSTASRNARTYVDTVLAYLAATYPSVKLNINPSLLSENLTQAKNNAGSVYNCPSIMAVSDLTSCLTTTLSHLTISAVNYSPYGYLAKKYTPYRFTTLHEPTSNNSNYFSSTGCLTLTLGSGGSGYVVGDIVNISGAGASGCAITVTGLSGSSISTWTMRTAGTGYTVSNGHATTGGTGSGATFNITALLGSSPGGAANWATFVGATNTEVSAQSGSTKVGIALDRFEKTYASTLIAASPAPVFVGNDVYTNDLSNTTNGLGADLNIMQTTTASGLEVTVNELWSPAWSPTGQLQGDGTAYEGVGNCDWRIYDRDRQSLTALTMFLVANGATEINYFSAATSGTVCVYGAPGNGNDKTTSTAYANAVAAGATHRSPTFTFLQNIANNWPSVVLAGQVLPF